MKMYDWTEYYDKYYDWSESTRERNLAYLTSLGSPEEVAEIIVDFDFDNQNAANKLLKMAIAEGIRFSSDDLCEFSLDLDEGLVHQAILLSVPVFSAEDIDNLYANFDEDIIREVCKKGNYPLPEELREEDDWEDSKNAESGDDWQIEPSPQKVGFWSKLAMAFAAADLFDAVTSKSHHTGVCDGDCENCPPHFGYRYGRWYYGHGHEYGCEFGGNKCDGGKD